MMIGILQPGYIPWLGFFEQMYRSDVFVIYDDVQYDKDGWRNRNRIKTKNGIQWLTIPVQLKFDKHPLIKDVLIDNSTDWRKKHLFSIRQNYSKAPFYSDYIDIFEDAYSKKWDYLIDIDLHLIFKLSEILGIDTNKIVKSSSLAITGDRIAKLIKICRHFDADIFYEGASGKNYIDTERFLNSGVKVEFQDYKHPVYNQLYGDFTPYMSAIDLIFNCGDKSLSILAAE